MIERHTIDFARVSFNVISDSDRSTITLQFDQAGGAAASIHGILRAVQRRFGGGFLSRLRRLSTGDSSPFVLPGRGNPHPDYPDVFCFELGVKPGTTSEAALAMLLNFVEQLPGYQRTYGSPLDPDKVTERGRTGSQHDASTVAQNTLLEFFKRRVERTKGASSKHVTRG